MISTRRSAFPYWKTAIFIKIAPPLLIADLTENHHSKTRFLIIGKQTIFIKIAPLLLIADLTENRPCKTRFLIGKQMKTAIFMNIAPMVLIPSQPLRFHDFPY